ncbi:MAG: hypothetical protein HRT61_23025 [Ekhidna sp.]|nr:hypothetical protein [Ekhidna sp.]
MRILIIALILSACAAKQDDKLFQESIEAHEAAIQISKEVTTKIGQIRDLSQQLQDSVMSVAVLDSASSLQEAYEFWETTVVEVPGHEDHHHHDHDHSHEAGPELTPEMTLDIQKDIRDRIAKINERAQSLLDSLK